MTNPDIPSTTPQPVNAPREDAIFYLDANFVPIPIGHRSKSPFLDGWQTLTVPTVRERIDTLFPDQPCNVGLLLGKPSGGLVDIDLDCKQTVDIASRFLPPSCRFGRASKPASHWLYRCEEIDATEPLRDPIDRSMLLEIRSTGGQTVVPPSTHECGEVIEFVVGDDPRRLTKVSADDLRKAARRLAAAALLGKHWPVKSRHAAQLALAGALLHEGWDDADAVEFLCAVCHLAGDEDRGKRQNTIHNTRGRIEANERVMHWGALARIVGRDVVRQASRWIAGHDRFEIEVSRLSMQMASTVDDAIDALALEPNVYRRGTEIVRVFRDVMPPKWLSRDAQAPLLRQIPYAAVRELIAKNAFWFQKVEKKEEIVKSPVLPPEWAVDGIVSRESWPALRPIAAVSETPVLRPDGTILSTPGYDDLTGILYEPNADYEPIPDHPTAQELARAVADIREAICDFQFEKPAHETGFFASVLTPLVKAAFDLRSPLFLFDASTPGVGKGLLSLTSGVIATGRLPSAISFPGQEDEREKRFTSCLMQGDRIIRFDNVEGFLGGKALCMLISEPIYTGRILGISKNWTGPADATLFATANNCQLGRDMDRRVCHIRLQTDDERPELRKGFKHPNLLSHVRKNQPRLTRAALIILRAYFAAGRPKQEFEPWGTFEVWADIVVGALRFAGLPDPGTAREELRLSANGETDSYRDLVCGWQALVKMKARPVTVSEALDAVFGRQGLETDQRFSLLRDSIRALLPKEPSRPSGLKVAGLLRKVAKRRFGDIRMVQAAIRDNQSCWTIESINPS